MTRKTAFLRFVAEYIGERVSTFEEFREILFEEVLKKDGYDNTLDLLLEVIEDYLRYEDNDEEEEAYDEF